MCRLGLVIVALLAFASGSDAAPPAKIDLRILYVGPASTPRGQGYLKFLQERFLHAESAERQGFEPRRAADFDVVMLDWSQQERDEKSPAPLGRKDAWEKPTVLLGSAGLMLAGVWHIHGAIG